MTSGNESQIEKNSKKSSPPSTSAQQNRGKKCHFSEKLHAQDVLELFLTEVNSSPSCSHQAFADIHPLQARSPHPGALHTLPSAVSNHKQVPDPLLGVFRWKEKVFRKTRPKPKASGKATVPREHLPALALPVLQPDLPRHLAMTAKNLGCVRERLFSPFKAT